MRAKKHLGQHFLKSEKALASIVETGDLRADDVVLEIGPGKGALTERLLVIARTVLAIEKDRELIPVLQTKFKKEITSGKLLLWQEDVLKFSPTNYPLLATNSYKLIANIPYYITGAIIEKFFSTSKQPSKMVLLIQKEVAERIVAKDGKESILSIAVKVYGQPKIISKVPAGAFVPAPKVDSAILSIANISREFFNNVDEKRFFEVLKAVFGKKRNQVSRSLGNFLNDKEVATRVLTQSDIDPKKRPEDMTLAQWKKLVQILQKLGVQ